MPSRGALQKRYRLPPRYTDTRDMIYLISDTPDLLVETDNLDYVKKVVRAHPNCSIRELGSGKVYRPRLVPGNTAAQGHAAASAKTPPAATAQTPPAGEAKSA